MNDLSSYPIKLFIKVLIRLMLAFLLLGALFFISAGTFHYLNGWIYIGTLFITMGTGFTVLFIKDKALLEKRINTSERESKQKIFIAFSSILILAIYGLPGFDYRYSWSQMPKEFIILGEVLLISGYAMNMTVMLVNSYASRTIEIQEKQKVIENGLYAVVRHPMYLSMIPIYIGTCFILGSYVALIPTALLICALGFRAINEEKALLNGLQGYQDYMKKVKYRIIPYIW